MLLIEKKLIEECEFEAEREFLLTHSKEVVVEECIHVFENGYLESDKNIKDFISYLMINGYKLIKIKQ